MRPCIHAYIHTYTNMYINVSLYTHFCCVKTWISMVTREALDGDARLKELEDPKRSISCEPKHKKPVSTKAILAMSAKEVAVTCPIHTTRLASRKTNETHTGMNGLGRKQINNIAWGRNIQEHTVRQYQSTSKSRAWIQLCQQEAKKTKITWSGRRPLKHIAKETTFYLIRAEIYSPEEDWLRGGVGVSLGNSKNLLGKKRSAEPKPVESMSLAVDCHFQMWERTRWDTANEKRERDIHTHTLFVRADDVMESFLLRRSLFCWILLSILQNCFCFVLACLSLNLFEFMSLKVHRWKTHSQVALHVQMHAHGLTSGRHRILARFSTANDVLLACSSRVFWLVYRLIAGSIHQQIRGLCIL